MQRSAWTRSRRWRVWPWVLLVGAAATAGQPDYRKAVLLAHLQDSRVLESSGLAASRRTPGVLWTHNDSGDGPYLYATDARGRALGRFTVTGATNVDWEDLAVGRGAVLVIGDIGNRPSRRTEAAIYRVPEPRVIPSRSGHDGRTLPAERYPFRYPDGRHDAETLLVGPRSGEILVVTKEASGASGVYQFPLPLRRDATVTLDRVGTLSLTSPLSYGRMATGGGMSPDGRLAVVRTYTDVYVWDVSPSATVARALSRPPRRYPLPIFGQGEAICFTPDGRHLLLTCEGAPCPLVRMPAPLAPALSRPAK